MRRQKAGATSAAVASGGNHASRKNQPRQKQSGKRTGSGARAKSSNNKRQEDAVSEYRAINKGNPFGDYWSIIKVTKGLEDGSLIKSTIQFQQFPKKNTKAFVTDPNGGTDIMIDGIKPRNRAFPGDIVAVKLLPKSKWKLQEDDYKAYCSQSKTSRAKRGDEIPDRFYRRLGEVVHIVEKKHSRKCVGYFLKMAKEKRMENAAFKQSDLRLPMMYIPLKDCPDYLKERLESPEEYEQTWFVAMLKEWPSFYGIADGQFVERLGEAGDIDVETERILIENCIDYSEFSDEVLACLPQDLPWTIPEEEFDSRKDLREECIFTIDPESSGDIDDALHCKALEDGTYEVGVHIADVSYFVKEYTALDREAEKRANTVYLVKPRQEDIPMLPELLWKDLCSLNPDNDKLTLSIIWNMDEDGKILDERCGRTVIHSCVRMSYAHAQQVIETPEKQFTEEEFPPITNGFRIPTIIEGVLNLNKIASNLRRKRFDNGALQLPRRYLQYILDTDTKLPISVEVEQEAESNFLVEEFMLLANTSVARRIYDADKDTAFLRRHLPPKAKGLQDTIDMCQKMGIDIEGTTAGDLQKSLKSYGGNDECSKGRAQVLTNLIGRTLHREMYFCSGTIEDEDSYRHYGLNLPQYTQFTSPIRRYADIIVHRLLAASLDYAEEPAKKVEELAAQALHCNFKESRAKDAQRQIRDIFFNTYVKMCGPIEEKATVMSVSQKCIEVLLIRLGLTQTVYLDALPHSGTDFDGTKHEKMLTICWKADGNHPEITQRIKIFTQVSCVLEEADTAPLALKTTIKRPDM